MMKKMTWLLLLVSMMIPTTLSAQLVKKDVLTDGTLLKGNSSLLKKNVPAPANKRVQKLSDSTKGLRRARKAAPSANVRTWDFEWNNALDEWTIVDNDNDGRAWNHFDNQTSVTGKMTTHDGHGVLYSESYNNDNFSPLTPDNWLISPEVTLGGVLSLWACEQSPEAYAEVFGVFVCVGDPSDLDNFVQVGTDKTTKLKMSEYSFDLSEYEGLTGHFAIRHYHCSDQFTLNIDDVCLDVNATYMSEPTNPTNLTADPSATTADVAWDGAEGDSWNLRYKVNNPNEKATLLWDLTQDNYQSQFEGWSVEDRDDDGYNWGLAYSDFDRELGDLEDVCFYSYSWDQNSGSLSPDNWLFTPVLPLGGAFTFWAKNEKEGYQDVLGVYVVTDGEEVQIGADFTPPLDWTKYTFDTSGYSGKVGKIAIVHHNCKDQYGVNVDYISYEKPGDEPSEWIEINGLTESQYTIEGLEPGTQYMVEVQAYTEKGETEWTEPTYFTTGIDVSVSAAGYATLYYSDKNLVVPEGVEASAITVEGGSMTKSLVYASNDIIPQGTGVLIQASKGNYVFGVTDEEGTQATENMLRGSDEDKETTGGDIYLMLSLNAQSDPESVGFYYGAENGGPFMNGAHKAYLALQEEQAAGVKCFLFNTTGINSIETVENNNAEVYTVTGMPVNKHANLPKGFYIVGGKKVVVK